MQKYLFTCRSFDHKYRINQIFPLLSAKKQVFTLWRCKLSLFTSRLTIATPQDKNLFLHFKKWEYLECVIIFESIVLVIYLCFKIYFPIDDHCTISPIKQNRVFFLHDALALIDQLSLSVICQLPRNHFLFFLNFCKISLRSRFFGLCVW